MGIALVVLAGVIGLVLGAHGENALDRTVFSALHVHRGSAFWIAAVSIGNPILVGVVALGAAGTALRSGRRTRALAVLAGPLAAGVICDFVLKTLVDARTHSVYQYPSGHTTGASALAAVVVLVAPRSRRGAFVALSGLVVALSCVGVVVLRMHTFTDALGGVLVGAGSLLAADGLLALAARARAGSSGAALDRELEVRQVDEP